MLDRVHEAADALEGTCKLLGEVLTPEEEHDDDFLEALDELVFCCATCEWWCNEAERGEDGETCLECEHDG